MRKKSNRLSITEVKFQQHGYAYLTYVVAGYSPDGRRVRKQFKTRQEAEAWASTEEIRYHNQNRDVHPVLTRLTHEQLLEAELAFSRLNGKHTLVDAVTYFLAAGIPPAKVIAIGDAVTEFVKHKEDKKSRVRPRTIIQIRSVLNLFAASVGPDKPVHEISTGDCEKFLAARSEVAKTYNNYRAELHSFFVHASGKKQGWHASNPAAAVDRIEEDGRGMPEIIKIDVSRGLMEYVETYENGVMVPYFALALFAGIRPGPGGELWKLLHSDAKDIATWVNLATRTIAIQPHISKIREYRTIKVQPNLAAWLTRYPIGVWPRNFDRHAKHIRAKFALGHDVLRHTFISMLVAKFGSIGEAAIQAGNTEAIVRKYYLNLTDAANADAFWAIAPSETKKQPNAQADDNALNNEAA